MVKAQNTGNASCRFRLRRSDLPPRNARFLVAKESVFSAQDAALPCAGRTFSQCVLPRPLRAALFHARSSGVRRNALFQRSGRAARAAQAECTSAVRVTEAYMSRPLYSVSREKHLCAARRWHGYVFALHRFQNGRAFAPHGRRRRRLASVKESAMISCFSRYVIFFFITIRIRYAGYHKKRRGAARHGS